MGKRVLVPAWGGTKPMTLQQCFNRAWDWAVVRKMPYCRVGGACLYRNTDNTTACLIGACIPDRDYRKEMDLAQANPATLVKRYPHLERVLGCPSANPEHFALLRDLQTCHDFASENSRSGCWVIVSQEEYLVEVERRLRVFATDNNLAIPGPKK